MGRMPPDARNPVRKLERTVVDMADTQFSLTAFMRLPMQQKLLTIIALSMVAALVVVVPLLTAGAAFLTTRGRVPLVRRTD